MVTDDHFHVQLAKLSYRCNSQSLKLAVDQYEKLLNIARTKNQQLLAHRRMSEHYMWAMAAFRAIAETTGESPDALLAKYGSKAEEVFARMAPLSQDDPWFWHNYSIVYMIRNRYWRAARCNKKALSLMNFPAARNVQQKLKKKLSFLYKFA